MRRISNSSLIPLISAIGDLDDDGDPYAAARGVINGTMLGLGFWAVIIWALL